MSLTIGKNRFKTAMIVGVIFAFFTAIIYTVAYMMGSDPRSAAVMALLFSGLTSFASYWFSDKIVIKMNGAKPPTAEQERILGPVIEGLCKAAGLPMPKIYVADDPSPNAFATGRNHRHSAVCVTSGLLERLNRDQVEGVLAHEISHIKNYDILLQTVASVMIGAAIIASDICSRMMFWGGRRRNSDRDSGSNIILFVIGLIFMIIAPIAGQLLRFSLSRNREYLADATAAKITGKPEHLADALEIIGGINVPVMRASKATEGMYISNPLNGKDVANLFSTHPPVMERVRILRGMSRN